MHRSWRADAAAACRVRAPRLSSTHSTLRRPAWHSPTSAAYFTASVPHPLERCGSFPAQPRAVAFRRSVIAPSAAPPRRRAAAPPRARNLNPTEPAPSHAVRGGFDVDAPRYTSRTSSAVCDGVCKHSPWPLKTTPGT